MDEKVYVMGHKNPDTDSICAAIGYAYYKRETGTQNAVAARLGEINKETEFVLEYFNADIPEFISTVKMQVKDVGIDRVIPIYPEISIRKAWNIMQKQNVKTLPVIDTAGKLTGVCTLSDLTSYYMDVSINNFFSKSNTSLKNIIETMSGRVINNYTFDFSNTNNIIVAAMDIEEVVKRIFKNDIVIVGDRIDVHKRAVERGATCLIITGNFKPEDEFLKYAEDNNCMVISVPHDSFTTARLINQSIPVSYVISNKNIISFDNEDFINEIKEIMLDTRYRAYPVIDNNKVIGTISRYHLIKGNRKKVILLDHNERAQSVHGLEEAEILEIIDHHRVGDIQTLTPVFFDNRPLGSTSTIIASYFFESGIAIPRKIAGLLCSAIISDTLLFKSPTSTNTDEVIARKLSDIAGIDIYDFSSMMFKAGTSLAGKSPEAIFYQDFKELNLGRSKVGIGQVTTMDLEGINSIKDELLHLMEDICIKRGYDLVLLMLTDIINKGSEILFTGKSRDMITQAFNVHTAKNSVYLPGVVSRKKQVIPNIASAMNK
ncbi:cobalt-dependent inorganic pyrophosphatase [Oxobacter pfennigii]|uniref:inorganic diphosphatase n=1 Tax=Oxobacter pfennigii TaxID=36849 RepID=A0A0P8WNE5_9CLOT|nr:putative manganese-dependent inorganic diphosphatase [Oxobacter pfennigii]KPU44058.1 cobalt-dependent inorganic pyrophosphatase [Oxobacter pfennigii]